MCRSANACQDCGSAMHGAIRSLYFLEVSPTGGMRICAAGKRLSRGKLCLWAENFFQVFLGSTDWCQLIIFY